MNTRSDVQENQPPSGCRRRWRLRFITTTAVAASLTGTVIVGFAAPALANFNVGAGVRLSSGQQVATTGYRLVMQTDGNLVMYNSASTALFSTHTSGQPGNYAVMQGDGNLVVYSSKGVARWSSATWGYGGAYLAVQTDGNLVIYSSGGTALWARTWQQTAAGAQKFAKVRFIAYGWSTASQYAPLNSLWTRESGWRWNATNRSSGAYGIPQSLPATKMAGANPDWRTSGLTQVIWGEQYIKGVYGTPQAAWNHEVRYGWY